MDQPNEDLDDRYRRKWESIFHGNELYVDEELDYEYEDSDSEDVADCFPIRYTWSPASSAASSPSSSRVASPCGRVINLIDDDGCAEKRRAFKKLARDYGKLVGMKQESSAPLLRQNWRKNADFKGILKRWRIRSLDVIFSFKDVLQVPECSGNVRLASMKQKMKRPLHHLRHRNAAVDAMSNLSIVVNNDLCTTSSPEFNPDMLTPFSINEPYFSLSTPKFPTGSGEQDLIAGNNPSGCYTKSSFSMLVPQDLDLHFLNTPSCNQMASPTEDTNFLDRSVFEACNKLVCDTMVTKVSQQPSQQHTNRPVRPGSAISFSRVLRDQPYNRPASVGSQRIVRPYTFSNTDEENTGEFSNFAATVVIPNVLPPMQDSTFPTIDHQDEDFDPDSSRQSNVPY